MPCLSIDIVILPTTKIKKNHLAKPKLVQTSFTMTRGESRTLAMEQRRYNRKTHEILT